MPITVDGGVGDGQGAAFLLDLLPAAAEDQGGSQRRTDEESGGPGAQTRLRGRRAKEFDRPMQPARQVLRVRER